MIFFKSISILTIFTMKCFQSESRINCYKCSSEESCRIDRKIEECDGYCISSNYSAEGIQMVEKACRSGDKKKLLNNCEDLKKVTTVIHCYVCNVDLCNHTLSRDSIPILIFFMVIINRISSHLRS